jgi:hypothetical protein
LANQGFKINNFDNEQYEIFISLHVAFISEDVHLVDLERLVHLNFYYSNSADDVFLIAVDAM